MNDTRGRGRGRRPAAEESFEVLRAQQDLVVEAQTSISRLLRTRKLKQADLAQRLDVSPARVSQMFGDDATNLTLKTIAKIYHVLGSRCRLVEADVQATSPAHVVEADSIVIDLDRRRRFRNEPSAASLAHSHRFDLHRTKQVAERRAYA